MSAHQLITAVTWAVFVALFLATAAEAIRRPSRAHTNICLLFAAPMLIILVALAGALGLLPQGSLFVALLAVLQLVIPYLTLRVARDFASVPAWVPPLALALVAGLALGSFTLPAGARWWLFPAQIACFVLLEAYAGAAFALEARQAAGITRRRLATAAAGCLLFALAAVAATLRPLGEGWLSLFELGVLGAGLCFFLGFAPPAGLRRSWQEPELRAFLRATAGLAHMDDERAVVRALERHVAASVGAPFARIGLWDQARNALRFEAEGEAFSLPVGAESVARRAFLEQRPARAGDVGLPVGIVAQAPHSWTTLAAPVTAGERRFGVLTVYAPREALFARDDLEVVELLANQSATILESRALVSDLAQVRARAEAARLKEDFLSAAAHDLKTPLTTLVAQAQLLRRRLGRNPQAPPDPRSVELIVSSAERLRELVSELLEAAMAERGRLVRARVSLDLDALVAPVCAAHSTPRHPCTYSSDGPALCLGDHERLTQLLEYLLDNAIKFSPDGGPVEVQLSHHGEELWLCVRDHGIGVAAADLPHLFERFYRGANVDDRSFAGMGLSLAICRAIAEQHGGRIWAESTLGAGSSFTVALPRWRDAGREHSDGPSRTDPDR